MRGVCAVLRYLQCCQWSRDFDVVAFDGGDDDAAAAAAAHLLNVA